MKKVYCYEWFGIRFSDFTRVSHQKIADSRFYEKFYCEFHRKFQSYSQLPESYKKSKDEVADFIFEIIKNKNMILSIGSGNGYIESRLSTLMDEHTKLNEKGGWGITAIEPSILASKWLESSNIKLLHGYFPDVLEPSEEFDVAYSSVIDYVFCDEEYLRFLKSVVDFGFEEFILTDIITPPVTLVTEFIKGIVKDLLSSMGLYESRQLWGYLRTIDEHKEFLTKAGFSHITVGEFSHGTYWIRARND